MMLCVRKSFFGAVWQQFVSIFFAASGSCTRQDTCVEFLFDFIPSIEGVHVREDRKWWDIWVRN
jgi:hypothetical protein